MTTINFPSGLVGEARRIKGTEIAAIAEQADGAGDNTGSFGSILSGCWLSTVDPGPYPFVLAGDAKPAWNRVLKGDLLYGVITLRRISITDGDEYDFDAHCEECRHKIPWRKNLSELPLKTLSPEAARKVRAGEPFETKAVGKRILYHLQTTGQEEPVTRLMKQTGRKQATIIDILAGQITSIEGVNPDIKARWRWLSELSMGELFDLRAATEEHDCGLDTAIEVRCQNRMCQWEQEINLPLGKRFFAPKKHKKMEASSPDPQSSSATSSAESPASGGGDSAPSSGGASTEVAATP